ncbi:MAG: Ltp family lipoprotein [Lachnospiraceae bacterium]|nr:Ltp family lipoprotein [Lachnospiraceae bacterium]
MKKKTFSHFLKTRYLTKLLVSMCIIVVSIGCLPVSAATVKLNKQKATMEKDSTLTLILDGTSSQVTWKSSNKSIASVTKKGKVTAVAEGVATITANYDGSKYTCTVTVVDSNKENNKNEKKQKQYKEKSVPSGLSVEEQNAYKSAKSYLSIMAFSREGLIRQLEYEGYSTTSAEVAIDLLEIDWIEQAKKSANSYIHTMPFSKTGLIHQLEYEGFSTSDATIAAESIDVDWFEQAVRSAKSYLSIMSFSRSGLISQLEYEGFTTEQAEYAATESGY